MCYRIFTFVLFLLYSVHSPLVNGSLATVDFEQLDAELKASIFSRASLWECTSDIQCTTSNTTCIDGYCECDAGYIYNTDMTKCLLAATAYNDECTETIQCSTQLLSGSICSEGVCICGEGFHYIHGRCYPSAGLGEACFSDVNCYVNADTEATSCVDGTCVCSEGFYQREYRTCRRGGWVEGDECAIDLDCRFENGICNTDGWVCTTSTAARISTDNDVLEVDDEEGSYVTRILGRVDENATIGTPCVSNDNCSTLENSRCGTAGTCICNRAFFPSDDLTVCIPEIGEECSSDDEVLITNSLCRNGTWSCGYSTLASLTQRICRKSTKHYNWSCLWDEQCYIFGPDSSCQSKRCLCNEGSHHVEEEKFCWVNRGISESCQADEDCYVEGLDLELSCTNSVCTCPNGTIPNSDNSGCRAENAQLGEVCEIDDDCTAANSICTESICSCPVNYYVLGSVCAAGVNASCSANDDCDVENSTCTDNVCTCADNFVAAATDSCLELADYGEECQSDIQCSTATNNTYCAEIVTITEDDQETKKNVCDCQSDYHYSYSRCYPKTAVGQSCSSLAECYVESGIENVVCRNSICVCSWDLSGSETTSCLIRTSDAKTFFLSIELGLILLSVKLFLV